ncbi:hypothetical protein KFU94_47930 [Chloroflexi bacterium TSY]|nr:hypothetical protein [Chloroflexi bacterium TSY]
MLAYGTNPNDPKREMMDVVELDDVSGKWLFRELNMSTSPPTLSSDDVACQECHGNPPRPFWHEYSTWPGIFGGQDDILTAAQANRINRIAEEQANSDRFHFLEVREQQGGRLFSLPGRYYSYVNTVFTMELGPAVGLSIFKRMQSSPHYDNLHEGFVLLECGGSVRRSAVWQRFESAMIEAGVSAVNRYNLVKTLGISPEHEFQLGHLPDELVPGREGFFWNQADGFLIDAVEFLVLDDMIQKDPIIGQKLTQLPENGTFGSGASSLEADRQHKMRQAFELTREARQDAREAAPPPGQRYADNIFRFGQGIFDPALNTVCRHLAERE